MKTALATLILLIASPFALSQNNSDWVFDDSTLPEIRISIHPDSLKEILADGNEQSDHEFPATFSITKNGVTETVENVGFRLRGNTSRNSKKKSFKVSFNTFVKGREYRDLDKMNLNGEHNDPTIMRAKVSWDIFKKMDVKTPRANHVALYINDELYGLYLNVEHIDDEFVIKQFGSDSGNLYKCLYPADLSYISSNASDYKKVEHGRRIYDLKTNTKEDNYADLATLIYFINKANDQEFEQEIHDYLNVDVTLRWMAIDALTGNWDNYWYNKNNYYLYNDVTTKQFVVIPYDYDNTLGIDFIDRDWSNRNIYSWGKTGANRPLTNRLLEVPTFKDWYSYYIVETIDQIFNEDSLFANIDRLKQQAQTTAEADLYRTKDYGYDINDFNRSFDEALGEHVDFGLKQFITLRKNSALNQLQQNDISPIIRSVKSQLVKPDGALTLTIEAEVIDDQKNLDVTAIVDISPSTTMVLKDDGLGVDKLANDGVYSASLDVSSFKNNIEFAVYAKDNSDKETRFPYNSNRKEILKNSSLTGRLLINELMADNGSIIADETGKFADWVEIYNTTDQPISMKGYYLTDDFEDQKQWAFPDTTIAAKDFLLIWTDSDPEDGPLHTNFSLSKNGEQVGLYFDSIIEITVVDTVTFGAQTEDVSYARIIDGGPEFEFNTNPTPGKKNNINVGLDDDTEIPIDIELLQNYPNPFNPSTNISFTLKKQQHITLQVFTTNGKLVSELATGVFTKGQHFVQFNGENLASGVYFYRLTTPEFILSKKFTLLK